MTTGTKQPLELGDEITSSPLSFHGLAWFWPDEPQEHFQRPSIPMARGAEEVAGTELCLNSQGRLHVRGSAFSHLCEPKFSCH
jgi:hypothetical protein